LDSSVVSTHTSLRRLAWRSQFQPIPGSEPRPGPQENADISTFNRPDSVDGVLVIISAKSAAGNCASQY